MERDFIVDYLKSYFANKPEVAFGYLFGSYAKGRAKSDSDLDIGIYINDYEPKSAYSYKLEEAETIQRVFGKEVDLTVINEASPLLRHEIFKYGILVKEPDWEFLVNYKVKSFYQYLDQIYITDRFFEKNKAKVRGEDLNGIR